MLDCQCGFLRSLSRWLVGLVLQLACNLAVNQHCVLKEVPRPLFNFTPILQHPPEFSPVRATCQPAVSVYLHVPTVIYSKAVCENSYVQLVILI